MFKKLKDIISKPIIFFIIEVVLPFLSVRIIPIIIKNFAEREAFLIGLGCSIFVAVWKLSYDFLDAKKEATDDRMKKTEKIEEISHHFDESIQTLENQVELLERDNEYYQLRNKLKSPYFHRMIDANYSRMFEEFKTKNAAVLSGRIETGPFRSETFGVEGIKATKHKLLAVSSVKNYWSRKPFIDNYLKAQYEVIEQKHVSIKRIFVGERAHLESLKELMKKQSEHGIKVYCLETDSGFCAPEWINEDFLIQDDLLIVDLKVDSHTPDAKGNETISEIKEEVASKIELFNQMLRDSYEFSAD